jgi:hypothetical protein
MEDLKQFAMGVAAYLPGWTVDEEDARDDSYFTRLVHPGIAGAGIYLQRDRQRGRVHVSGAYPGGFGPYREERLDITVSMEREAQAAARDIERRFLGAYLAGFREAQETAYRVALQQAQAHDLADELAALMGCEARHGQDSSQIWSNHGSFVVMSSSSGPYITVERLYSLTPELAKKMARMFAEG